MNLLFAALANFKIYEIYKFYFLFLNVVFASSRLHVFASFNSTQHEIISSRAGDRTHDKSSCLRDLNHMFVPIALTCARFRFDF